MLATVSPLTVISPLAEFAKYLLQQIFGQNTTKETPSVPVLLPEPPIRFGVGINIASGDSLEPFEAHLYTAIRQAGAEVQQISSSDLAQYRRTQVWPRGAYSTFPDVVLVIVVKNVVPVNVCGDIAYSCTMSADIYDRTRLLKDESCTVEVPKARARAFEELAAFVTREAWAVRQTQIDRENPLSGLQSARTYI